MVGVRAEIGELLLIIAVREIKLCEVEIIEFSISIWELVIDHKQEFMEEFDVTEEEWNNFFSRNTSFTCQDNIILDKLLEDTIKSSYFIGSLLDKPNCQLIFPEPILEAYSNKEDTMKDKKESYQLIPFLPDVKKIFKQNFEKATEKFPEIPAKLLYDFVHKEKCNCNRKVKLILQENAIVLNEFISQVTKQPTKVEFSNQQLEPIVKEFDDLVQMEMFLKQLRKEGKRIQNVSTTPKTDGGYILIVR